MTEKYKDSEIIIRAAKKEDMPAVAELIQELADTENMSDGPKLSVQDLQRDGYETQPALFSCLVAEVESRVVGYALYFSTYSTWEGRATLLEDLCVCRGVRGRGAGARLLAGVARAARGEGAARLDLHVLRGNPARAFYESRGARNLTAEEEWHYYRFSGDALSALADSTF